MAVYEVERDVSKINSEAFLTKGVLPHFHNTIEILCVLSGSVEVNLNGKISVLTKGYTVFCDSFDVHSYTMLDEDSEGMVWVIPKGIVKKFFVGISNKKFKNQIFKDEDCFNQLTFIFTAIQKYLKHDKPNHYLIDCLGQAAFAVVTNRLELTDKNTSEETDIMKDILFYIYDNFLEDLSLKQIASKFGYSPNHFSHIFNSYMRISLNNFINNLRAEHSAELIKNNMSVTYAAENSGFNSLRTFYRTFKERYGVTPKEYAHRLLRKP